MTAVTAVGTVELRPVILTVTVEPSTTEGIPDTVNIVFDVPEAAPIAYKQIHGMHLMYVEMQVPWVQFYAESSEWDATEADILGAICAALRTKGYEPTIERA